jgi:iron complex outermembrane recepter protein
MVTLRGSVSTGFRAPSLHQLFTQKAQYSFVPGQGIQVSGLFNNDAAAVRALGIEQLKAEKSKNITLGLGVKTDPNTSFTIDYYQIAMKDRIVLGKEIYPTGDPTNTVDKILTANGIVSMSFFSNALDSKTSGIDYVMSKKNIPMFDGKLGLNLSGNYTLDNKRDGDIHNPASISATGQSVFDRTQEALVFTSRPKFKTILGMDLDYAKFNYSLNNTVFGPTRFHQAGIDTNLDTEFKTKLVTDFAVNYQITPAMTFSFNINNVFDVTPKWEFKALNAAGEALLKSTALDPSYGLTPIQMQTNLITFNGRYSMVTYDGSHFSQLGRTFAASLQYRF